MAATEDHAAEAREIVCRGKKSRVAGDAIHEAGRGIVDDTAQHLAVGEFGGSDAREFSGGRQETGIDHLKWLKDFLHGVAIESQTAHDPHEFAEDNEVDVAVDEGAPGGAAEFFLAGEGDAGFVAGPDGVGVDVRTQARVMHQKLPNRDGTFVVLRKGREVADDGCVELEFAAFDELHDGGGGRDDLGQRSRVIDCVLADGLGGRREGALTVSLAVDFAVAFEPEHTAGNLFRGDGLGDGRIHGRQFFRFERCGCDRRE